MLSDEGLIKNTEKLLKEQPEVFEALMEFERTKKVPKFTYKKRVNFTLDPELFRKFRDFCDKKGMKMSTRIEKLMEEDVRN